MSEHLSISQEYLLFDLTKLAHGLDTEHNSFYQNSVDIFVKKSLFIRE